MGMGLLQVFFQKGDASSPGIGCGIGLDVHLLQDRFEIVNDLFGFSEEVQPRYRMYISYEFLKSLWIYGGVDYLFEPSLRDYFIGLQLRFNDDNLKTILPFAGGASAAAK